MLEDFVRSLDRVPRLNIRVRKTRVATPQQMASLPLHAKAVGTIDLTRLHEVLNEKALSRVKFLLQSLSSSATPSVPPSPAFRVPRAHADILVESGACEFVHSDDLDGLFPVNYMNYFAVVETRDSCDSPTGLADRLRPIMWPRAANENGYLSDFSLLSVDEYRKLVAGRPTGTGARAYDVAASFWQVDVRPFACFVMVCDDGTLLRMNRLPYGVNSGSEIMHIITSACAGDPRYSVTPSQNLAAVHIDNALYIGDEDALQTDNALFLNNCRRIGLQLNEDDSNKFSFTKTFSGITFSFADGTVCLPAKQISRISELKPPATSRDLQHVMGAFIHAGTVLGLHWVDYVLLIKSYRRICLVSSCSPIGWR